MTAPTCDGQCVHAGDLIACAPDLIAYPDPACSLHGEQPRLTVEGVPGGYLVYPEGTWVRLDGGTLDLDQYRGWRHRLRYRARRAWGWFRYGWRWW